MKVNCTFDVKWLSEDGEGVDEIVEQEIIDVVTRKISTNFIEKIKKEAERKLEVIQENAVKNLNLFLEGKAKEFFEDWLTKELAITDSWGDRKFEGNMSDLIKFKFEEIINKKVDDNGNFGSYNCKNTYFEYLTKVLVKKEIEDKLFSLKSFIKEEIERYKNEFMKNEMSKVIEKLMEK